MSKESIEATNKAVNTANEILHILHINRIEFEYIFHQKDFIFSCSKQHYVFLYSLFCHKCQIKNISEYTFLTLQW